MSKSLVSLAATIGSVLQHWRARSVEKELYEPVALRRANNDLSRRFDPVQDALPPPAEKRLRALDRFRHEQQLAASEWRLVFAGLADRDESHGPVLDDDLLFHRVHREVDTRIDRLSLARRDWLALCFSYFFYDASQPDTNGNWRLLRSDIDRGFDAVRRRSGREREWMRIVAAHRYLFGEQAGTRLADELFAGRASDLSVLRAIAQVPDNSWLWQRIVASLLKRIDALDDDVFLHRLPELVALGQLNTLYFDRMLGACLARYHCSRHRDQPSVLLKQVALERWGSPQLRSRQNAWLQYVDAPVHAMVLAWFAREDLEHFFTLLKGEAGVDQARLFYWLRFADQMSYTRIVLGSSAWHNPARDFVEFRARNRGRLGQLAGGPAHNNAVIMQIGDYFFVEFSGTGHACYVYRADTAPFDPEKRMLGLSTELRQRGRELLRMPHLPSPGRPNVLEGWLRKFDDELRRLGIVALRSGPDAPAHAHAHASATRPAGTAASRPCVGSDAPPSTEPEALEARISAALGSTPYRTFDRRPKGGVFHVQLLRDNANAGVALKRLGFTPVKNNPLMFWRR